jgi:N-methylhydantoinase A
MSQPGDGSVRIGVDVGGTFTDLVVAVGTGEASVFKVPSTPADPAEGVLRALDVAAQSFGYDTAELLKRCSLFVHGSTIATNTLLENKGAVVGLLTTAGFRDSLEIRRGMRESPWRHRYPNPPVLVPRRLRLPVRGRLDANGREVVALAGADVEEAGALFRKEVVESAAICLLNSYHNPAHEHAAAEVLRRAWGKEWISISSEISPFVGEYERTSTAVVNAYVAPRTVGYLKYLDATLKQRGLSHSILLIQNNGGAISVDQIEGKPVALLLSGPAAAVGALEHYWRSTKSQNLISMEIGGTSCDVIVMRNGAVEVTDYFQVSGYHLALPSVEVHSIGAGGGTIAGVDSSGMLYVGPRGAGAKPGPASYGLGGSDPTITDAQIVLGRLRPGPYVHGAVILDAALAANAIEEKIARPLGLSLERAAAGMVELLEQHLLHAVQRLSTERGYDPREFVLVAAGGAGPLHGVSVGRLLKCRTVFVPRLSGAFCALGMLHAKVRHDVVRGYVQALDEVCPKALQAEFESLQAQVQRDLVQGGFAEEQSASYEMDLRYVGQQWSVRIPVSTLSPDKSRLRGDFEKEYMRLYGHHQPGGIVEVTALRVIGWGPLPALREPIGDAATGEPRPYHRRRVFLSKASGWDVIDIFRGADLHPGHARKGPLIIEEQTTTVFVGPGDHLFVDAAGNFLIELSEDGATP